MTPGTRLKLEFGVLLAIGLLMAWATFANLWDVLARWV